MHIMMYVLLAKVTRFIYCMEFMVQVIVLG